MVTTIDSAGRVVIPKQLRTAAGVDGLAVTQGEAREELERQRR